MNWRGWLRAEPMSKGRLEAFSDGVFAIIVTLLVLEVHVPHLEAHHTWEDTLWALIFLLPQIFSFVVSFIYVSIYWVNHHQFFLRLSHTDLPLLWLNNLLLLFLAFVPFPTALIGDYPDDVVAVVFYGMAMLAPALCYALMWRYAAARGTLLAPDCDARQASQALRRSLIGPALYFVALFIALASTRVAVALYIAIPLFYLIPGTMAGPSGASESAD